MRKHIHVGGVGGELCILHSLHAMFGLCDLLWVPLNSPIVCFDY